MVVGAAVVLGATLLFGIVGRALLQRRRTGTSGIRGIRRDAPAAEKLAGVLLASSVVLFVLGIVLGERTVLWVPYAFRVGGLVLAVAGLACMLWAQWAMGASWRIGVDPSEEVDLVVGGPFRLVRNPIFTSMFAIGIGLAVAVPNAAMIAAAACLVLSIEFQVRVVEEPHLHRSQGRPYDLYCSRTGRFVPGIGTRTRWAEG